MAFTTYIYIGLLIYAVYVIIVGFIGAKRIRKLSDFSVASEALGPIPVGLAFTASFFSAVTFLGYVGYSYAWGQCSLWIFLAIFFASTLGLIMFAKGVRERNIQLKALSIADWLGTAYKDDKLRLLVALVLLIQLTTIGSQFSALSTLLEGLTGIDYKVLVIITAILTAAYVTMGGLFADVYTSIGQTLIMMVGGLVVFLSGFMRFEGGVTEVSSILANQNPNFIALTNPNSLHMYAWSAILGVFIVEYAFSAQPHVLNKVLALKDPRDTKKMIWTWIVASFMCMVIMFGGFYMRALDQTLAKPDLAVVEYVKRYFHPVITALLAVAIIAGGQSSACGLLVAITTGIANDLYLKTLVKHKIINVSEDKAERVALIMSRILPTVLALISAGLAIKPPAFMAVMGWIGFSSVASATLAPILFATFWPKRATSTAAIAGFIVGETTYVLLYLVTKIEKSVMAAGGWGVVVSLITMWIVSSLTTSNEQVKA